MKEVEEKMSYLEKYENNKIPMQENTGGGSSSNNKYPPPK